MQRSVLRYSKVTVPATGKTIGVLPQIHKNRQSVNAGSRTFQIKDGKAVAKLGGIKQVSDMVTHTGQFYTDDDLRNIRFSAKGAKKIVNPNWAIDLIAEVPVIPHHGRIAMCDGTKDPLGGQDIDANLGHQKIYINLDKGKVGTCLYCGLKFRNVDYHDPYDEDEH